MLPAVKSLALLLAALLYVTRAHHLPPYPSVAIIVTLICGLIMLQRFDCTRDVTQTNHPHHRR